MPINSAVRQQIFNLMQSNFQTETTYYARDDVATTSHQVGVSDSESWTQDLLQQGILTRAPKKGDRYVELERSWTVLYNFKLFELEPGIAHYAILLPVI